MKWKSIDDILADLEKIKNDPEIPMPVIEAGPATLDEVLEYAKKIPEEEAGTGLGTEEEEKLKDKESLEDLRCRSGPVMLEHRPKAFPEELWQFVLNDQKPLVKDRWEGYQQDTIAQDIGKLLTELKYQRKDPMLNHTSRRKR